MTFEELNIGDSFTIDGEELSIKIEQSECETGINVLTFYKSGNDFYFHNMEPNDPVREIKNLNMNYSFDI